MSEIKEKLTVEQIQQKLIEKLTSSGWAKLLRGYLFSSDFVKAIEFLVNENEEGRRFTPALKQVFRAFEECPLSTVKVVIIGQD
jgi:uracil DNA glycosylase